MCRSTHTNDPANERDVATGIIADVFVVFGASRRCARGGNGIHHQQQQQVRIDAVEASETEQQATIRVEALNETRADVEILRGSIRRLNQRATEEREDSLRDRQELSTRFRGELDRLARPINAIVAEQQQLTARLELLEAAQRRWQTGHERDHDHGQEEHEEQLAAEQQQLMARLELLEAAQQRQQTDHERNHRQEEREEQLAGAVQAISDMRQQRVLDSQTLDARMATLRRLVHEIGATNELLVQRVAETGESVNELMTKSRGDAMRMDTLRSQLQRLGVSVEAFWETGSAAVRAVQATNQDVGERLATVERQQHDGENQTRRVDAAVTALAATVKERHERQAGLPPQRSAEFDRLTNRQNELERQMSAMRSRDQRLCETTSNTPSASGSSSNAAARSRTGPRQTATPQREIGINMDGRIRTMEQNIQAERGQMNDRMRTMEQNFQAERGGMTDRMRTMEQHLATLLADLEQRRLTPPNDDASREIDRLRQENAVLRQQRDDAVHSKEEYKQKAKDDILKRLR